MVTSTCSRTSFCAVFPIDNPRYLVFVLLDQPHGTKETVGFALAGYTAAPLAGRVISRIAPLLGVPQRAPASGCPEQHIMAPQSGAMIAALTVGKNAMEASKEFSGLASDSRKVKPGYLFAALSGSHADGARLRRRTRWRAARSRCSAGRELRARVEALGVHASSPTTIHALGLAREAAAFFGAQPKIVAAVTGTKGKTSIVVFLREIWTALGKPAASLGTIGVVTPKGEIAAHPHHARSDGNSSPAGAVESTTASSIWPSKRPATAWISTGWTASISRRRLHQHHPRSPGLSPDLRGLPRRQAAPVLAKWCGRTASRSSMPMPTHADTFRRGRAGRGACACSRSAKAARPFKLLSRAPRARRPGALAFSYDGQTYSVALPLAGAFQASNALVAAGLAIGLGDDAGKVFAALEHLKGAPGPAGEGRLRRLAARRSMSITPTRRMRWRRC